MPIVPTTPQPLEYNDGLLSGAAGPSVCGPGDSPLAKAAAHRMAHTLRGNHRPLDIIAFGGSVTHGDIWQGVIDGNVFPRVLASQLVERGLARSVRVRNLAIGATHGAAPMALCCDTLIHEGSAIRTLDIDQNYDRRRWPWEVNRTYRGAVPPAELSADAPPPIILLEFGINGISWVDVLLKRLRQRYPRAILVYVDLTGLHAWRAAAPKGTGRPPNINSNPKGKGRPNQRVWSNPNPNPSPSPNPSLNPNPDPNPNPNPNQAQSARVEPHVGGGPRMHDPAAGMAAASGLRVLVDAWGAEAAAREL